MLVLPIPLYGAVMPRVSSRRSIERSGARAAAVATVALFGGATIVPILALWCATSAVEDARTLAATASSLSALVAFFTTRAKTPARGSVLAVVLATLAPIAMIVAIERTVRGHHVPDFVGAAVLGAFIGVPYGFAFAPIVRAAVAAAHERAQDGIDTLLVRVAAYLAFAAWLGANRLGAAFRVAAIGLGALAIASAVAITVRDRRRLAMIDALRRRALDGLRLVGNEWMPPAPMRIVPLVHLEGAPFDAVIVRDRVVPSRAYRTCPEFDPIALVTHDLARERAAVASRLVVVTIMSAIFLFAGVSSVPSLVNGAVRLGLLDVISRDNVTREMWRIRSAIQIYREEHSGTCPSVADLRDAEVLDRNASASDPFGSPYVLRCDGEQVEVRSAGRDGRWGTIDDVDAGVGSR